MRSLKDMAVCVAVSDVIIFLFHCAVINLFRVCTGHGKPGKSWNFRISFFLAWKVLEFKCGPCKVIENDVD